MTDGTAMTARSSGPGIPRVPQLSVSSALSLVIALHGLAAIVFAWALWNIAAAIWALESLPRTAIGIGATVGLVANILAGSALALSWRRGRTISFTVTYLTLVIVVIALFQYLDAAALIDDFATAFNRAFLPFIGLCIAFAWTVFARRLTHQLEDSSSAARPAWIPVAIRVMRVAGLAGLALFGLVWLWQLDIPVLVGALADSFSASFVVNAALTIAFVLLLWSARVMWSTRMATRFATTGSQLEAQAGWIFLSPNLIGFILFFAGPLIFSLVISFFDWNGLTSPVFIGLGNYTETLGLNFAATGGNLATGYTAVLSTPAVVIGASDPLFWRSITNILFFLLLAVPLAVAPALVLAALINVGYRGTKVFRTIFFVPAVAGVIGVTLIWKQMLNSTVGFINWAIGVFNGFVNSIVPGDPMPVPVEIGWLSDPRVALIAVVLVFAWSQFGFNTVLFTAGMQGISRELYEAAELDGAGSWRRFVSITIPSLRATTFFVVASTVILALQLFDIVYALNQPNPVGFPDNATLTPVVYLYQLGFQQSAFGQASAVAWVLFILIFGLTLVQFRRQRRFAESS